MENKLKQSIEILCEELRNDPSYFYSWQANIAVAFQDAYHRELTVHTRETIHKISNEAATEFLNILIKK
jgi:hypothetical protein